MTNSFNIVSIILLLGATQGLFLAVLLFNKPGNKKANRLLAFLMLFYSMFIVEASLSSTFLAEKYPHMLGLAAGIVCLIGPFHYLYARALISRQFSFSKKTVLHAIPFVLFYLCNLVPFYLKSGADKLALIRQIALEGRPPILMFFNWLVIFQGIIYLLLTLLLLKKHSIAIKDNFSYLKKVNLNWLRIITILSLGVWGLTCIIEFLQLFGLATSVEISIVIALMIYVMGYLGLRQPEIFAEIPKIKEPPKYKRSGLTPEKAKQLHQKLIQLMETQKPFTDSNLKLNQLAKMMPTSPNYLSQVINEERQQNFFDFVNRYRIEEAKKIIGNSSPAQTTLLSIAYDVGFNSKSAFNSSFKKHTLMTPSQFRKSLLQKQYMN